MQLDKFVSSRQIWYALIYWSAHQCSAHLHGLPYRCTGTELKNISSYSLLCFINTEIYKYVIWDTVTKYKHLEKIVAKNTEKIEEELLITSSRTASSNQSKRIEGISTHCSSAGARWSLKAPCNTNHSMILQFCDSVFPVLSFTRVQECCFVGNEVVFSQWSSVSFSIS